MTAAAEGAFALAGPDLSREDFRRIAALVTEQTGIQLPTGKEGLVRSRLAKRLRVLGLDSFSAYVDRVTSGRDAAERQHMLDALTTNKTSWWREAQHFALLAELAPTLAQGRAAPVLWSAGCSTGEEPYTIAMVLAEALPASQKAGARILATDLSTRVLDRARRGRYAPDELDGVPAAHRQKHFTPVRDASGEWHEVAAPIRRQVQFAQLNLMGPWPMKGPFDAIFCRNVMIYFDKPTQAKLVGRYWELLRPGGHLFIGHSESLTGLEHRYAYVAPAVYRK